MINLFAATLVFFNIFYSLPPDWTLFRHVELQDGESIVQVDSVKQFGSTSTNAKMTCEFFSANSNNMVLLSRQEHVYSCGVKVKLALPAYLFVRIHNDEKVEAKYQVRVNHK